MSIRRINLFGESGVGKSTVAARLYSELKTKNYSVELVREEIKLAAYKGDFPKSYKQLSYFSKQIEMEDDFLQYVDLVVSDSPIHLNVAYSKYYGFECWPELLDIANKWEAKMPSINFLVWKEHKYSQIGRYQTEAEAEVVSKVIEDMMLYNLNVNCTYRWKMNIEDMMSLIQRDLKDQ